MDVLIALGTTAAWGYSTIIVAALLLGVPNVDPSTYYDTAAIIIALILLGKYFEEVAKGRASEALRKLMDLQPRTAKVLRDGKEEDIPVELVQVFRQRDERTVGGAPPRRAVAGVADLHLRAEARVVRQDDRRVLNRQ